MRSVAFSRSALRATLVRKFEDFAFNIAVRRRLAGHLRVVGGCRSIGYAFFVPDYGERIMDDGVHLR